MGLRWIVDSSMSGSDKLAMGSGSGETRKGQQHFLISFRSSVNKLMHFYYFNPFIIFSYLPEMLYFEVRRRKRHKIES
jgi:hypothetical protein